MVALHEPEAFSGLSAAVRSDCCPGSNRVRWELRWWGFTRLLQPLRPTLSRTAPAADRTALVAPSSGQRPKDGEVFTVRRR